VLWCARCGPLQADPANVELEVIRDLYPLYFPPEFGWHGVQDDQRFLITAQLFCEFFKSYDGSELLREVSSDGGPCALVMACDRRARRLARRLAVAVQVNLLRDTVVHLNYDDFLTRSPFDDFASALVEEPECVLAAMGVSLCVVRPQPCMRACLHACVHARRMTFCVTLAETRHDVPAAADVKADGSHRERTPRDAAATFEGQLHQYVAM
jgi:hypothetical protein